MKACQWLRPSTIVVVLGILPVLLTPTLGWAQDRSVVTYAEGDQSQRIYVSYRYTDGTLHINWWDGSHWAWADQGTPPTAAVSLEPSVITYREETQRIYAFVRGTNGRLYVNWWDGSHWAWADQGTPPTAAVSLEPSVITYREETQRIYAFVRGTNGRLYINWWDGSQWAWADQGTPPGTTVADVPSAITYREETQPQRIYAFVRGANGRLYVNWWDGSQWAWADQGTPPGTTVSDKPSVITYREGTQPQRIYAFVRGANDRLYVNWWDGSQWTWADQGTPPGTVVTAEPDVVTYHEGTQAQRIYAFARGANDRLYVNWWDGSQWAWADQGAPPTTAASTVSGVITYREGTQPQRIYAFVRGVNDRLYVNWWDGSQWAWADQTAAVDTIGHSYFRIVATPPTGNLIETTKDWCRSGAAIHVFDRYFAIDGSSQLPIGDTGPALVVPKGANGILSLTQDRWRWLCGNYPNASVGAAGGALGSVADDECKNATNGDNSSDGGVIGGIAYAGCSALAYLIPELVHGLLGNWNAARCVGATKVRFSYGTNGRIVWDCYDH